MWKATAVSPSASGAVRRADVNALGLILLK